MDREARKPQAAEAPKYVERPAVVEPKAETSRTETSRAETATPQGQAQGGQDAAVRYSPRERRTRKARRPGELR